MHTVSSRERTSTPSPDPAQERDARTETQLRERETVSYGMRFHNCVSFHMYIPQVQIQTRPGGNRGIRRLCVVSSPPLMHPATPVSHTTDPSSLDEGRKNQRRKYPPPPQPPSVYCVCMLQGSETRGSNDGEAMNMELLAMDVDDSVADVTGRFRGQG